MPHLSVPARFNGPPRSGNGGWVAGALAATLPGQAVGRAVTVTLRRPPPLETALPLRADGEGVVAEAPDGSDPPVAQAAPASVDLRPVAPVPVEVAEAAQASYAGLGEHPFPGCFVCGPAREPGDGLRIFAGPLPGGGRSAATWTPDEVGVAITWAALDCPSAWASDLAERPLVLGRITALVHRLPRVGEPHVVVGEVRHVDGRRTHTAATLYAAGDEVVATAEHVWFAIDPQEFR